MSTRVYKDRRRLSEALGAVGSSIAGLWAYPTFHETYGNTNFVVLHSVQVDDGVLQVVGDGDDGCYEWLWFHLPEPTSSHTAPVTYSRAGYGSSTRALYEGLKQVVEGGAL